MTVVMVLLLIMAALGCTRSESDNSKEQTIDVWGSWKDQEGAAFKTVLDQFERDRKNIKVRYTPMDEDMGLALEKSIKAGNAPDVAILPQPGTMRYLADRKELHPIQDILGDALKSNYDEFWQGMGRIGSNTYGVWFRQSHKSIIWYRPEAYKGTPLPQNWEELKLASQKLLEAGVTPIALGGRDAWTITDWFENVYLRTAGAERYDRLACGQIAWTDNTVTTALVRMTEVLGQPAFVSNGPGAVSVAFDASVDEVFGPRARAAMLHGADYVGGFIRDRVKANPQFIPFPAIDDSGPDNVVVGGDVGVLLKDSPGGRDFIRYLATPRAAEPWVAKGGFLSPNRNVIFAQYTDPVSRQLAQEIRDAGVRTFDLSDLLPPAFGSTGGRGIFQEFQDFLVDPSNVKQTAEQLERVALVAGARCG